jgi:tyrosinase
MAIRVRKDASTLEVTPEKWDDTLYWYAKAVERMRERKIAEPASWRYQAAIHDYIPGDDPYADASDVLPSDAEQERFWRQCQHFSWFFLPWHRWYLLHFEEIVAATINELGGPGDTWALPYWNYSGANQPDARRIPAAFIAETLPDGSPNPLRVEERDFGNDGDPVGGRRDVSLACLRERTFEPTPRDLGFGGPETGFNHDIPGDVGVLEAVPHGSMHGQVGGFMGFFHTAGLDPLFWLHHCNVDRLWVVWRELDANHADPAASGWLDDVTFDFNDAKGNVVTVASRATVDTRALGYEYEQTSEEAPAVLSAAVAEDIAMAKDRIAEMVGASDAPTPLTTAPTTANVAVSAPTGPALLSAEEGPQRVFIRVENVTGQGKPRRYSVYVNEVFAGIIPLFGVTEATRATEKHGGGGLNYRLDVTEAVDQLKSEGKWDEANVQVTFVPDEKQVANEAAVLSSAGPEEAPSFQVGRVSVFVA